MISQCQDWGANVRIEEKLYFTSGYRGFPPYTLSQHPDNKETGYSNVLASFHPRRWNCQALWITRKRRLTPWKRFSPTSFLRKAKMVLRSVQPEWINFTSIGTQKDLGCAQSCRGNAKDDVAFSLNLLLDLALCTVTKLGWKSDQRQTW